VLTGRPMWPTSHTAPSSTARCWTVSGRDDSARPYWRPRTIWRYRRHLGRSNSSRALGRTMPNRPSPHIIPGPSPWLPRQPSPTTRRSGHRGGRPDQGYRPVPANDGINLTVPGVFGLLGPSGAGRHVRPDAGR
jgi:hypothetical protein